MPRKSTQSQVFVLMERYCEGPITGQWNEWITLTRRKRNGYRLRAGTSNSFELRVSVPGIVNGADLVNALRTCLSECQFDDTVSSREEVPDFDALLATVGKIDSDLERGARAFLKSEEEQEGEEVQPHVRPGITVWSGLEHLDRSRKKGRR